MEEAPHEDDLLAELAGEQPQEDMQRVGDVRHGPLNAREAGRQRPAHMAQPEAEGGRWVAPRHPAAGVLLPCAQAAAARGGQPLGSGRQLPPQLTVGRRPLGGGGGGGGGGGLGGGFREGRLGGGV